MLGLYLSFTATATDANGCAGLQVYTATIAVGPPPEVFIPTLSEWGMIALTLILECTAVFIYEKEAKEVVLFENELVK